MTKQPSAPRIITLPETGSTNRYAAELLKLEAVEEFTTIRAVDQTAGKGQKGSWWESEKEKNLTFTIIVKPTFLPFDRHFFLSVITSLSITDFVQTSIPGVSIKWPNDIYWDNKKIGGILIENTLGPTEFKESLLGIGLNINQEVFISDAPNPSSLKQITGNHYPLEESLHNILMHFQYRYRQLQEEAYAILLREYYSRMLGYGTIRSFESNGKRFLASIKGVKESGELILERMDGAELVFNFKELEFLFED
jgi:BirA family transcriptional regulator, biotin operon repressor / biotin---[acetyl-CoA-carboxylase] ligase